jgi:hypothetical protein
MVPDDLPKQPQEISRPRARFIDKAVANTRNKSDEIKEAPRKYIPETRLTARNISNIGNTRAIRLMAKSGIN